VRLCLCEPGAARAAIAVSSRLRRRGGPSGGQLSKAQPRARLPLVATGYWLDDDRARVCCAARAGTVAAGGGLEYASFVSMCRGVRGEDVLTTSVCVLQHYNCN
jgi:hypothetical protein